jgi:opacity protein-like surface antigen
VGIDYAFNTNWIVGVEYRHYDFGTKRSVPILAATGALNTFDTTDLALRADTLVARLSYKFGVPRPVVAKY